jgi:hypothetical protein
MPVITTGIGASGTRTLSARAGRPKPNAAPSTTRSAAKPHRPTRRPDPRIPTRSLRPISLPTRDLTSSSRHFHVLNERKVHARTRGYQTDRVDVKYSPVRFGPLRIRFGESNARVSNLPNHRELTEFLNPTPARDPVLVRETSTPGCTPPPEPLSLMAPESQGKSYRHRHHGSSGPALPRRAGQGRGQRLNDQGLLALLTQAQRDCLEAHLRGQAVSQAQAIEAWATESAANEDIPADT